MKKAQHLGKTPKKLFNEGLDRLDIEIDAFFVKHYSKSPIFVRKFNFDKTLLNQVFEFLRYNCKIFLNILS